MTNDVSVKPSYSDQWFVAKPIIMKTHSRQINTQSQKFFILLRSFFFSGEPQAYLFYSSPNLLSSTHQPPALRKPTSHTQALSSYRPNQCRPSLPSPPMTSAAPPSNPPLGARASAAYAGSCRPWAAPTARAPSDSRQLPSKLPPSRVVPFVQGPPSPPSAAPCQPRRLFLASLLPPSVVVLSRHRPLPFLPLPPSPVLIVLGPLLNCC
jgi:hypothetical protein